MYKIYRIFAKWTYEDDGKRNNNSTSFYTMQKDNPSLDKIKEWAEKEWWKSILNERKDDRGFANIDGLQIEVTYKFDAEWCPGWFNHWTFDCGQTDAELLASFQEHVKRFEYLREGDKDYYCLMGAEERYRWCGLENHGSAPCRCDGCKKHGVIRICH